LDEVVGSAATAVPGGAILAEVGPDWSAWASQEEIAVGAGDSLRVRRNAWVILLAGGTMYVAARRWRGGGRGRNKSSVCYLPFSCVSCNASSVMRNVMAASSEGAEVFSWPAAALLRIPAIADCTRGLGCLAACRKMRPLFVVVCQVCLTAANLRQPGWHLDSTSRPQREEGMVGPHQVSPPPVVTSASICPFRSSLAFP
jgi:hypothetical protein